jgi:hypothetical protein
VKIEKVFELGHHLARSPELERVAVLMKAGPLWPAGFYLLRDGELEPVTQRREVAPMNLDGRLDEDTAEANTWLPAKAHCWCDMCKANREHMRTQQD